MKKIVYALCAVLLLIASCKGRPRTAGPVEVSPEDSIVAVKASMALPEEPVFDIVTNYGTIRVRLFKDTPLHRDNFEKLALSGYYDGLLFHRVINGFVIQGGDPFTRDTSLIAQWGEGGPSYTIPAEMRDAEGNPLHTHVKGALAAARQGDIANPYKESSGSQFYLVQDPDHCRHLDGEYTVFGETVAGLHVIDKIAAVKKDNRDRPLDPVIIKSVKPNESMNNEILGTEFAANNHE